MHGPIGQHRRRIARRRAISSRRSRDQRQLRRTPYRAREAGDASARGRVRGRKVWSASCLSHSRASRRSLAQCKSRVGPRSSWSQDGRRKPSYSQRSARWRCRPSSAPGRAQSSRGTRGCSRRGRRRPAVSKARAQGRPEAARSRAAESHTLKPKAAATHLLHAGLLEALDDVLGELDVACHSASVVFVFWFVWEQYLGKTADRGVI